MTIVESRPISVTGYTRDTIYQDFAMSSVTATGSGIDPTSLGPWMFHLNPVFRVLDSPTGHTLSRITIRASEGSGSSRLLRQELADVLNVLLQSVITAASPVGYVDALRRVSDFSLKSSSGHLEIEARITSAPVEAIARSVSLPSEPSQQQHLEDPTQQNESLSGQADQESNHPRLASELRAMTGLSASALGDAFGVSREQYSRWISGKAISDIRHGQLIFLHTVAREMVRRLGIDQARIWIHTPIDGDLTPAKFLELRRFDKFYREVTAIPDPEPVKQGSIISLSAPVSTPDDDEGDDDDEPWSPPYVPE